LETVCSVHGVPIVSHPLKGVGTCRGLT
jgi:hypothetical protein